MSVLHCAESFPPNFYTFLYCHCHLLFFFMFFCCFSSFFLFLDLLPLSRTKITTHTHTHTHTIIFLHTHTYIYIYIYKVATTFAHKYWTRMQLWLANSTLAQRFLRLCSTHLTSLLIIVYILFGPFISYKDYEVL
jgi:hypothetical protein